MAYKRKYKKGKRITSLDALHLELAQGRYVFLWDRPKHPGWIQSMQFRTVQAFLNRGFLAFALPNP